MTILLCTEESILLTSLEYRFRKAGWRLELAHDHDTALAKAQKEAPALVVVDLRMPEYQGLDIIQRIHKDIDPALPILVAGILKDKKLLLEALRLGGQDFITAPFMPDELTLRIKCLLERHKTVIGH